MLSALLTLEKNDTSIAENIHRPDWLYRPFNAVSCWCITRLCLCDEADLKIRLNKYAQVAVKVHNAIKIWLSEIQHYIRLKQKWIRKDGYIPEPEQVY